MPPFFRRAAATLLCLVSTLTGLRADVVINEVMAAASERLLQWSSAGVPRVGAGPVWYQPSFDDSSWSSGAAPLGFGTFTSAPPVIATNIATPMLNLTPTTYLRKGFTVSAPDAARTDQLQLVINYNDGFICHINGVEVARRWAGPAGQMHFHDQPAYNPNLSNTSTNPTTHTSETINLGAVNTRLVAGTNVIAVHALNWTRKSANFYIQPVLRISGASTLVAGSDVWKYLVGVVEPSGGLYDPALLSSGKLSVPWGTVGFDDSTWASGAGPLRAGTTGTGTVVGGVIGVTPSFYARTTFNVLANQLMETTAVQLQIDYDDAYVAYLNGVEVARANIGNANTFTPQTAVATTARNSGTTSTVALDLPSKLLVAGANVLAVQAHNVAINDSDVYLKADLKLGSGATLVANTQTWRYFAGTDEPVPADDSIEDSPEGPDSATDWVELYNTGSSAVSLQGWRLTDNSSDRSKWVFPNVTIPAGGYLVVICDDRDATGSPGGYLHAGFSLGGEGEFFGLYDQSGNVVQRFTPTLPKASPFHSYGRNAAGTYVYSDTPTPGAENNGTELAGFVADPAFNLTGGFHTTTQSVTLSTTTSGATIRYTTDGSVPTETTGTKYTSAILVSASTAIRARAFKPGMIPSAPVTRTFLILGASDAKRSLPAVCLTAEPARDLYRPYGMFAISNNGTGYYTSGIWTALGDPSQYFNPVLSGRYAEHPANWQMSYPSGASGFNFDFGLRCAGSPHSRPRYVCSWLNNADPNSTTPWPSSATQKPQMNTFFRDSYSGTLEFPLFPGSAVTGFETLRLRAGKNDISNPFVRDELMRRTFIDTGNKGAHGINTTLWVNGVYKGYYNVTERLREDFFQRWYDSTQAWDIWVVNDTASGDSLMLQETTTFLRNNPQSVLANYQGALARIDVVNFADYILANVYGAMGDWPHNNYTIARERSTAGRWQFAMWDGEGSFGSFTTTLYSNPFIPAASGAVAQGVIVGSGAATDSLNFTLRNFYTLLHQSPEFKLLMADRIQKHFFNNGALTDAAMMSRKNVLRNEMLPLIPSFSDTPFNNWINGKGDITRRTGTTNAPSRRQVLLNGYYDDTAGGAFVQAFFKYEGVWPATRAPAFSQQGGTVARNFSLTMTNPNGIGTLYFTTNGNDPRAMGGAVQGTAYTGAITIGQTTTVKARVLNGTEWSPLMEATFLVTQPPALLITELMYHAPDAGLVSGDEYDFLEVKNAGPTTVNLSGMRIAGGVSFTFPAGAQLAPGGFAVVAKNAALFAARYPAVATVGSFTSNLANSGETITLVDLAASPIFSVTYSDTPPWPTLPDGFGNSLVPVNPNSNPSPDLASSWRASSALGGSPGADDPPSTVPAILVNEVLASSGPEQDDKVEIFNPTGAAADLSGWFLTDNASTPNKFRVPDGTIIGAGGYLVLSEADFNPAVAVGGNTSFAFDGNGETVRLSSADALGNLTGYAHGFEFGAAAVGVSFGRHVPSTGVEAFPQQRAMTFGNANAGPQVGPVVISELMYHPATGGDEFLELRNISNAAVPLYDPANLANTWKIDGIAFNFPQGVTLQPGQVILVTPLTAAAWRTKYGTPAAIQICGPYAGALSNSGEAISLQMPGVPYLNAFAQVVVPMIDVDGVRYLPASPWPTGAAGTGKSLERFDLTAYGDDPANWRLAASNGGSPGVPLPMNFATWQTLYFTPAQIATTGAAGADAEGDGLTNLQEFAFARNPLVPDAGDPFPAALATDGAGGPYLTTQYRRSLAAMNLQFFTDTSADLSSWEPGAGVQVGAAVNNGDGTETVSVRDAIPATAGSSRFLRIRMVGN
jgi:hypothetical protein